MQLGSEYHEPGSIFFHMRFFSTYAYVRGYTATSWGWSSAWEMRCVRSSPFCSYAGKIPLPHGSDLFRLTIAMYASGHEIPSDSSRKRETQADRRQAAA